VLQLLHMGFGCESRVGTELCWGCTIWILGVRVEYELVYAGVAQHGLWVSESASSRFMLGLYNIGSGNGSQLGAGSCWDCM